MGEYKINVDDHLPNFSAVDQDGERLTDQDLIGSPFVLYFYPKDDTPGCTKEACSFRDIVDELDNIDALVVGVSPDGMESHQKFIAKHHLNFPLLCDEKMELCRKFDVVKEKEVEGKKIKGIERTTFVFDSDGVLRWLERPVNVEGHAQRVLEALNEIEMS